MKLNRRGNAMLLPVTMIDTATQALQAAGSGQQDIPVKGDDGEVGVGALGDEMDGRSPEVLSRPELPSEEARRRHELTHIPYADWCRWCVQGRGREAHHRRQGAVEDTTPVIAMGYCFLGPEELGSEMATTLVIRDSVSSCLGASLVPAKSVDKFAIAFLSAYSSTR